MTGLAWDVMPRFFSLRGIFFAPFSKLIHAKEWFDMRQDRALDLVDRFRIVRLLSVAGSRLRGVRLHTMLLRHGAI